MTEQERADAERELDDVLARIAALVILRIVADEAESTHCEGDGSR